MQSPLLHQVQQPHAAFLGELNLDSGAQASVAREEAGQDALRCLRRGPDSKHSHDAPGQSTSTLANRLRLCQDVATVSQQILALGRELDATTDSIEELHSELRLQVADLAREGRLADVDVLGGPRDAALLGDAHEIAEMPKLHRVPSMPQKH